MYAKIENSAVAKYPYTLGDLRAENPHTSFPTELSAEDLAEFGVVVVSSTSRPVVDHTKTVFESIPVNDGGWKQVWVITEASPEELAQRTQECELQVRGERNGLLTKSDWTQVADAPVDKQAWAAYRQALRNITAQAGFPFSVQWPEQPAV